MEREKEGRELQGERARKEKREKRDEKRGKEKIERKEKKEKKEREKESEIERNNVVGGGGRGAARKIRVTLCYRGTVHGFSGYVSMIFYHFAAVFWWV